MTKFKILLTIILLFTAFLGFSQGEEEDKELGRMASSSKMIEAKSSYNKNNLRGALNLYREVLESEPGNYVALYWTSKCHYELKNFDLANTYVEKAMVIKPDGYKDIELFRGMIDHRLANLDEAIIHFETFIAADKRKPYQMEAAEYIRQCKFAKRMMANAVDVEITNLGDNVNSRFDDYTPSINANGDLLLFTSRRSNTTGGKIDRDGDFKFFEDIYFSRLNKETGEWGRAAGVEGFVNTDSYDAILSISPKGDKMYLYKNNKNNAGDIFISSYKSVTETWSEPEKMPRPINTSYFETSASVTEDGKTMYFISNRDGGSGRGDIYRVDKNDKGEWGNPKNLGKIVNTMEDEKFVFIHPNGKTLFFASDGHQTMGGYDLFKTEFVNDQWSFPINLGYPINTVNEESTFSLTRDNQTLLIAAGYEDTFGERDLYKIDVSKYPLLSEGYKKSGYGTLKCTVLNDIGGAVSGAKISFYYMDSDILLTDIKTDRDGLAVINLPGNMDYSMKVEGKKGLFTVKDFRMNMEEEGNTVLEISVNL